MGQLVELNRWRAAFAALGVRVAATTADAPRPRRRFAEKHDIGYPLLGDRGGRNARRFGVFDRLNARGDRAYGVPEPGVMLLSGSGLVLAKFAEPGYRKRPAFADVYRGVRDALTVDATTLRRADPPAAPRGAAGTRAP